MVVVDSGALRSICNTEHARDFGLEKTSYTVLLCGVGNKEAIVAKPIQLRWENRECQTCLLVVDIPGFPFLLGLQDAAKLGMILHFPLKKVLPADPRTLCMNLSDYACLEESEEKNRVTGLAEGATEEDVIQEGMQQIEATLGGQLTQRQKHQVKQLFREKATAWLRPQTGKLRTTPASFSVSDRPYKAKLRNWNAEMKKEIELQVKNLLEAGAIRPSHSP